MKKEEIIASIEGFDVDDFELYMLWYYTGGNYSDYPDNVRFEKFYDLVEFLHSNGYLIPYGVYDKSNDREVKFEGSTEEFMQDIKAHFDKYRNLDIDLAFLKYKYLMGIWSKPLDDIIEEINNMNFIQ